MSDQSLSLQLASHYTALRLDEIPNEIAEIAKLHILDSIGCLLAGLRLVPGKLACDLAVANTGAADAPATLFATGGRVGYLDAVQAMSVAAHCGEMDDIHGGAGICIGAMVVPALLAMAEKFGGTGPRFLEATIAGYEAEIRIGLSIDAPKLFARGWWPSTVCGAFGVAAAGAKFLDWSADQAANAFGIASLHSGGMITGGNEGATARHLAFGHAARNGIVSLLAAEQGFTGPKRAFEDPRGFCLTLCPEPRLEHLRDFDSFHLPEVAFKPYPCARQLHAGVEALLRILQQHAFASEHIDSIELGVPTANASMVDRPSITPTHAATVGSGQYVMAATAFRGKIDLSSFDAEYLNNDHIRSLMTKVRVVADTALDRHFPQYWPGRVMLKAAGESYAEEVIIPKGESGNPMQPNEVTDKFLSLAAPVIGQENARSAIQQIEALDSSDSLEGLLSSLEPRN